MAKFVLVKDLEGNDVYLNLESLIDIHVSPFGMITAYSGSKIIRYEIGSPETIEKIKNYIKENML